MKPHYKPTAPSKPKPKPNFHGESTQAEIDKATEALTQILGWRELRSAANSFPVERVEEIARTALREIRAGEPD